MSKDGKLHPHGDPPDRRTAPVDRRRSTPRKQKSFVERATAASHSGYGSESVRPHLQDQLRLKGLMRVSFPPPAEPGPGKDEHHQ